jgi:hypothetical protein
MKRALAPAVAAAALCLAAPPALAHSAARGFVLLLPVAHVIAAGAVAVLVSFCVVWLVPDRLFIRGAKSAATAGPPPALLNGISIASAAVAGLFIAVGLFGPHDPLGNLLPLGVWTLWWVLIVLLHPLLGNIWAALNPFVGLHALVWRGRAPPFAYPAALSYWPAFVTFLGFAWFQLVDPAPEDPPRLAVVVIGYAAITFAGMFLFGSAAWLRQADPFAVFLRQLGAAAPLRWGGVQYPGAGLLDLPVLPLSGVLFILLTLSSISFDGLGHTFLWLSAIGINPLDYPGRTALVTAGTAGLVLAFLALAAASIACVYAGWAWAGRPVPFGRLLGRLVYSLIPISIAYHFAHYLPDLLVNLQYLALALSDPLGTGADYLGLGGRHVTASFLNTASGALSMFSAQAAAIVIGHAVGVAVAHAIVVERRLPRSVAIRLEFPLAALMVAYTAFGLWLLSTPAVV